MSQRIPQHIALSKYTDSVVKSTSKPSLCAKCDDLREELLQLGALRVSIRHRS